MPETLRLFSNPGMSGEENDVDATPGPHEVRPEFRARSATNESGWVAELFSDPSGPPVAEIGPHDEEPMIGNVPINSVVFTQP